MDSTQLRLSLFPEVVQPLGHNRGGLGLPRLIRPIERAAHHLPGGVVGCGLAVSAVGAELGDCVAAVDSLPDAVVLVGDNVHVVPHGCLFLHLVKGLVWVEQTASSGI